MEKQRTWSFRLFDDISRLLLCFNFPSYTSLIPRLISDEPHCSRKRGKYRRKTGYIQTGRRCDACWWRLDVTEILLRISLALSVYSFSFADYFLDIDWRPRLIKLGVSTLITEYLFLDVSTSTEKYSQVLPESGISSVRLFDGFGFGLASSRVWNMQQRCWLIDHRIAIAM